MPGPANYATTADVFAQLSSIPSSQQAQYTSLLTGLLNVASRAVDGFCDRIFYDEGAATRYFDGNGTNRLVIPGRDIRSVTSLQVLWVEGSDFTGNFYVQFSGDGVTPPSNFRLEPANPGFAGKAGDTNLRPYERIVIPEQLVQGTTGWIPTFTQGKRTVKISASWGWPVIPDEINLVTTKIAVRLFLGSESSLSGLQGDPEISPQLNLRNILDVSDLYTLTRYRRQNL